MSGKCRFSFKAYINNLMIHSSSYQKPFMCFSDPLLCRLLFLAQVTTQLKKSCLPDENLHVIGEKGRDTWNLKLPVMIDTLLTLTFTFESFENWLCCTHAVCGKHNATVSIENKHIFTKFFITNFVAQEVWYCSSLSTLYLSILHTLEENDLEGKPLLHTHKKNIPYNVHMM